MNTQFVFEHISTSRDLEDYAKTKLMPPIQKFSTKPVHLRLAFRPEGNQKCAHCQLLGGDGLDVNIEAKSDDFYTAVDSIERKLTRRLRNQKEKIKLHRSREFQHHNLPVSPAPYLEELTEDHY